MSLAELIPAIRELTRPDQEHLLEVLRQELEQSGEPSALTEGDYPVWSPHNAHEAAATLLGVLQDAESVD